MRILFLLPRVVRGGVWSQMKLWAEYLTSHGHKVYLGTSSEKSNLVSEFKWESVFHMPLFPSSPVNLFSSRRKLDRFVEENDVDLIHSHHRFSTVVAGLSRLAKTTPIVSSIHDYQDDWKWIVRKWTGNLLLVPSDALKRHMIDHYHVPDEMVYVVRNAIDPSIRPEQGQLNSLKRTVLGEPSDITIGFIGRLDKRKGASYLIRSLPMLKRSRPHCRLIIAGGGPQEGYLRALSARLSLEKDCVFLGERTDIPEILYMVDIVAIPSVSESFGIVALEAMRSSKPVVATNTGGLSEVVLNGVSGTLVAPQSPEALAQAISMLAQDSEKREAFGRSGFQRLMHSFTPEISCRDLLVAYSRAIELHAITSVG